MLGTCSFLKKSPATLIRITERVINRLIKHEEDINTLCIPKVLQIELKKKYLQDKFECEETLPPLEEEEMSCWFEEPFLNLSNDEWLTIMSWKYGVPYFAHEKNHIKYVYFTVDDGIDRYCWPCAFQYLKTIAVYKIEKWSTCEFERAEDLIDTIQCMNCWCNRCMTRSLFWITSWTWNTDHHLLPCSELLETYYV